MMTDPTLRALGEACAGIAISQGPAALARELARIAPEYAFRQVLSRGGWYRLGGVIDAAGQTVAHHLKQWAEAELATHDDDMQALAEDYAGRGFRATRLTGKTHYWVARTGPGTAEYLQMEIEELQEVVCHALFEPNDLPDNLEELVDPREDCGLRLVPLGVPFYSLRRVTQVADFLDRMRSQRPDPQSIHRFIESWDQSSAGHSVPFSHHWVIAVREYLDRYRQTILEATPVVAINGRLPKFESAFGARGLALHDALMRFDSQVGYRMAWFFHMLTTKTVPHAVAVAVVEDQQAGFSYLPERDLQVTKDWLHQPFGF